MALFARGTAHLQKELRASEQDWPDVARERERWKRYQGRINPHCLVATVPQARWTTMTFLAALRVQCPINGYLFLAWVTQSLVPTLQPGDIAVLDRSGKP